MTIVEHRAAARIAWRSSWRAKARTALVLFLIALPIAALAGAGIIIISVIKTPQDEATALMGSGDLIVYSQRPSPTSPTAIGLEDLRRALPAGTVFVTSKGIDAYRLAQGTLLSLVVREYSVAPDRPPVAAIYSLKAGRMPKEAGEVSITPHAARLLGLKIGDTVTIRDLHPRIVGLAVVRESLNTDVVLAGPGTLRNQASLNESPADGEWIIDLPLGFSEQQAQTSLATLNRDGLLGLQGRQELVDRRAQDQKRVSSASFGLAAVALFGTGLIAAAALGVGARRQLRGLGLVGAGGGEPRHVRAIVLWGGALQGLIGSALGIVFAIIAVMIAAPHLESLVNRVVGDVRVPWWAIAGGLALGTAAATVAAIGPARQAAAVSTIDALAGRAPKPRAPGRTARWGAIAVLIGSGLTVLATISDERNLLAIALVVTLSGFLFAIPLLVSLVGRASAHLPGLLRLAARQASRYGRRTGAAVAAATLALSGPVAVAAFTQSAEVHDNRLAPIGNDQMVLGTYDPESTSAVPESIVDAARAAIPGSVAARIRWAEPKTTPKTTAGFLYPSGVEGVAPGSLFAEGVPGSLQVTGPQVAFRDGGVGAATSESGSLAIADADLLRVAHGEQGIPYLDTDKIVVVGGHTDAGVVHLQIDEQIPAKGGGVTSREHRVDVPAVSVTPSTGRINRGLPQYSYTSFLPLYYISPRGAARYGLEGRTSTQVVMRAPHAFSAAEIDRVKHAVAKIPGGFAQSQHDYMSDFTLPRLLITAGAVALALVIVAAAVALAAAESRRERAILSAVGAGPFIRRQLAGANAFLLTAIAGVLAVPAGFLPVALIQRARQAGYPVITPWIIVGIVAIGAPLIAGLIGILGSREPKSHALLQPVW